MNIKKMLKLGIVLALFATAACVMLAFVYSFTADIIEKNSQAALNEALKELFPNADDFLEINAVTSPDPSVKIEAAFAAMSGSIEPIGVALTVSRASYSGPIKTMVGVNTEGFITSVKILEHTDTPGFGANAASPTYFVDRANGITFYGQFAGKKVSDPFAVKDDIIIITSSTITSRAVSDSVKAAALAANAWLKGRSE